MNAIKWTCPCTSSSTAAQRGGCAPCDIRYPILHGDQVKQPCHSEASSRHLGTHRPPAASIRARPQARRCRRLWRWRRRRRGHLDRVVPG